MLHILLVLLKVIGIIILVVLGLIIFLLACILFSPIRYSATVEYDKELQLKGKVTYLFHAISLTYDKDRDIPIILRICGIKTNYFNKEEKEKKKKYDEETEMFEEMAKEFAYNSTNSIPESLLKQESSFQSSNLIESSSLDEDIIANDSSNNEASNNFISSNEALDDDKKHEDEEIKSKISIFSKIKSFISKIRYIISSICDKIKTVFSSVKSFIAFIKADDTKELFRFAKGELILLFNYIRPRKLKGFINFGFEDPSVTGKLLGAYYVVTKGRLSKFKVTPDFENPIIKADINLSGRFMVFQLLIIVWHIYKNKKAMEFINSRRA